MEKNINKANLTPRWVTGFTDAEGNFSINYTKVSGKISVAFKITQKDHSIDVLFAIKDFFQCGKVYTDNKKNGASKFQVSDKDSIINKIIPHFEKYPLITSKSLDYISFKECIELLNNKNRNLESIINIKNNMNRGRSDIERYKYLNESLPIIIDPNWLQGFIDGEGCFYSYMGSNIYINTLEISQSYHDILVLEAIKNFFHKGNISPKYDPCDFSQLKTKYKYTFKISNSEAVIEFISKYNMLTRKHLDYLDWIRMVKLKNSKAYKTKDGLKLMLEIKQGMNSGRKSSVSTLQSKLFDFASGSLIFIFIVISLIASGLNDQEESDTVYPDNMNSSEDNYLPDSKSDSSFDNLFEGLTDSEIKTLDIYVQNLINFNENRKINLVQVNDDSSINLENIISLIKGNTPNNVTEDEELMSEAVIREIRCGYSPTFWLQNETISDSDSLKELQRLTKQSDDSDVSSVKQKSSDEDPNIDSIDTNNDSTNTQKPIKRIIIVSQPAGDSPAPLPSWTNLPTAPSVDSPLRNEWIRDVAERKYWSNRIEWIDAGRPLDRLQLDQRTIDWVLNTPSDNVPGDDIEPKDIPLPVQDDLEIKSLEGKHKDISKEEALKVERDSWTLLQKNTKK